MVLTECNGQNGPGAGEKAGRKDGDTEVDCESRNGFNQKLNGERTTCMAKSLDAKFQGARRPATAFTENAAAANIVEAEEKPRIMFFSL